MTNLRLAPLVAAGALVLVAACGGSGGGRTSTPLLSETASRASVTVRPSPLATATAVPRVVAAGGYRAVDVFPHIAFPQMLGLYVVPGDESSAVVLTRNGVIYRASLAEDREPAVFLDLTTRIAERLGQEEGLLGLAFAPDYSTSGAFYVNYTAGGPRRNVISRFTARGASADPSSERVVLEVEQPFSNHNGGGMAFGPDGYLYIAFGDGGSGGDPYGNGQNTGVLLGKILRIDVSRDPYTIPPDNPFATGGGRGEVFAYGLRNPWRFAFDRETGEIWTGDVGQNRKEEVDRVVKGGNYGWNIMEGDECYGAATCDRTGLTLPRATYGRDDGCSVTGGYVYRGEAMPELRGWYLYSDYCSGKVWAVNTVGESPPVLLADTGHPVTSFAEDAAGELYLVTFEEAIFRIERR